MNQSVIENLKAKLNRRVMYIEKANYSTLAAQIKMLIEFLQTEPVWKALVDDLIEKNPTNGFEIYTVIKRNKNLISLLTYQQGNRPSLNKTLSRLASDAYGFLTAFCKNWTYDITEETSRIKVLSPVNGEGKKVPEKEVITEFFNVYVEPLIGYLNETLDEIKLKLFLLIRYKHRSEWFKGAYLAELVQRELERVEQEYKKRQEEAKKKGTDEKKVTKPKAQIEKVLAQDLYAYLFDEGLHFNIEPKSLRGAVDLIEAQTGNDRLLLDVKVFDNQNRNRAYLLKAFYQIYKYTQQYNQPFGYLVIFKTCQDDLSIASKQSEQGIPFIQYNHKTIFFVVVDIHQYGQAVSQRPGLVSTQILEEEFVTYLEEQPIPPLD